MCKALADPLKHKRVAKTATVPKEKFMYINCLKCSAPFGGRIAGAVKKVYVPSVVDGGLPSARSIWKVCNATQKGFGAQMRDTRPIPNLVKSSNEEIETFVQGRC